MKDEERKLRRKREDGGRRERMEETLRGWRKK